MRGTIMAVNPSSVNHMQQPNELLIAQAHAQMSAGKLTAVQLVGAYGADHALLACAA